MAESAVVLVGFVLASAAAAPGVEFIRREEPSSRGCSSSGS